MRHRWLIVLAPLSACARPARTPAGVTSSSAAYTAAARTADSLALLRLHERQREAHLARRADWLVAEQADTVVSVSNGRVSRSAREAVRASFQRYLDSATFQAWDDIVPPRIRLSADGSMAYVIVEKRVHLTSPGADGASVAERTRFAWLTVYEKRGGAWTMTAIASTDRPDAP